MDLLEELALGVHSGLVLGHTLGVYYNFRRARRIDRWCVFHAAAAFLSALAAHTHAKRLDLPRPA